MPFNSHSYHANKYRRRALEALAEARAQPAYDHLPPAEWRTRCVHLARLYWRSYLVFRGLRRMQIDSRAMHRGEMTPTAFIEKWSA